MCRGEKHGQYDSNLEINSVDQRQDRNKTLVPLIVKGVALEFSIERMHSVNAGTCAGSLVRCCDAGDLPDNQA
jgi:hypothetical protein